MPLLPPLFVAACLSACSDRSAATADNGVDVAAAASRGQSDIANYAAAAAVQPGNVASRAEPPRPSPSASLSPTPQGVATAVALEQPGDVVRRYLQAISARRYADAWQLWESGGAASGMSEAAFAASFARYASFEANVGAPSDEDAGAGQRYVTVPVTVTGTLRTGGPFRLEGPVILHRIADGIESDDPDAHRWRIRSSEMKPRPPRATSTAP